MALDASARPIAASGVGQAAKTGAIALELGRFEGRRAGRGLGWRWRARVFGLGEAGAPLALPEEEGEWAFGVDASRGERGAIKEVGAEGGREEARDGRRTQQGRVFAGGFEEAAERWQVGLGIGEVEDDAGVRRGHGRGRLWGGGCGAEQKAKGKDRGRHRGSQTQLSLVFSRRATLRKRRLPT